MITPVKQNQVSEISENARIKLFRLTIQKLTDNDYDVVKIGYRSPRTAIATRKVGVETINLFKKGCTIKEVREILSQRYNCTVDRIQISPLIQSLMKARMMKSIDGDVITEDQINLPRYVYLLSKIRFYKAFRFLYSIIIVNLPPVIWAYPTLAKIVFMLQTRDDKKKNPSVMPVVVKNLKQAFPSVSEGEINKIGQSYLYNRMKIAIDYRLLGGTMKIYPRWLRAFSSCSGIEYLDAAITQNKGVLLCGYHFGFMFLIPMVLCSLGYNITTVGYTGRGFDSNFYIQLNETFKKAGFGEFKMLNFVDLKRLASMVKLLEKGSIVLIMADADMGALFSKSPEIGRYMGSDTVNYRAAQTNVNILGHSISANKGLAWLHLQTGTPVVPVRMFRTEKDTQQLIIKPALQLQDAENGKKKIDEITYKIYETLEREVNQNPAQWLYWHRIHQM